MDWIYLFGDGEARGGRADKELLGGKGANLAEMTRIGLPVPPGFTITTDACRHYLETGESPPGLWEEVEEGIGRMEAWTDRTFGGGERPLLVAVRSGAAVSMPGMMDTILNLGLDDHTVEALAEEAGDERFAWDCYRRLVQMYGEVVLKIDARRFEERIEERKRDLGVTSDAELDPGALRTLVDEFRRTLEAEGGEPFPADPREQLHGAVEAVFRSWNNERAISYRRVNDIPDDLGTAVSVVAMVYGNMGDDSGSGVAFTRDPSSGEDRLYGEFLANAQGEDVVAGTRDPFPVAEMEQKLPEAHAELLRVRGILERHYGEMQDLEFTVERGRLYLLQTRTGKRTAAAAVKIAVDMAEEGLIDHREALLRVEPSQLDRLLHPQVDPAADVDELAEGLPASPGAAVGRVVFSAERALERAEAGDEVILVRRETSPDDFEGMVASQGVLTARGGMTSHAAVVARGIGKCCVVGASALDVQESDGRFAVGERVVEEGDWITLDGTRGRVLGGRAPTVEPERTPEFEKLLEWADQARRLRVRANADTPEDAVRARENGAEGIGLCRTEHMFFQDDRLEAMRQMILAGDAEHRETALARLLPMQRSDFEGIFRAMDGLPVAIRLLDPPLHEFLPGPGEDLADLAERSGRTGEEVAEEVKRRRETNPMLGHRGVRLGVTFPEITEMQVRAILESALAVSRDGVDTHAEIMVPLVATVRELDDQRAVIERVADEVFGEAGSSVPFAVGTMIELPRAALTAGEIAPRADFFSFGTNDLTQTVLGLSRDDSGTFLPEYLDRGILPADPFQTIDRPGVGRLVRVAVEEGRAARPDLELGVCGEHGGDGDSVGFFHEVGLDYVSCSPFRVPAARLAAGRAAVRDGDATPG